MRYLTALALIGLFGFASCKKDLAVGDNPDYKEPAASMSELQIDSDFDWSTSNDVELSLVTHSPQIIRIQTENGDDLLKGMAKPNIAFESKITVPAYTDRVIVFFGDKKVALPIQGSNLSYLNY